MRRRNRKKIGRKYDRYNAKAGRDIRALKAVELPILIRASSATHIATRNSALMGNLKLLFTCAN